MYCKNCGHELQDNSEFCVYCGARQGSNNVNGKDSSTLALLSIIFAFVQPIVGLILGIVGVLQGKSSKSKKMAIVGLILSFIMLFVYLILTFVFLDRMLEKIYELIDSETYLIFLLGK